MRLIWKAIIATAHRRSVFTQLHTREIQSMPHIFFKSSDQSLDNLLTDATACLDSVVHMAAKLTVCPTGAAGAALVANEPDFWQLWASRDQGQSWLDWCSSAGFGSPVGLQ